MTVLKGAYRIDNALFDPHHLQARITIPDLRISGSAMLYYPLKFLPHHVGRYIANAVKFCLRVSRNVGYGPYYMYITSHHII